MRISPINLIKTSEITAKPKINKAATKPCSVPVLPAVPAALAIASFANRGISDKDIEKKLLNLNYKKDEQGNLVKNFTKDDEIILSKKYGKYAQDYKTLLQNPVTTSDIKSFKTFIDIDKKTGEKLYKNNFENFFTIFCILKNNNNLSSIKAKGPEMMKIISNVAENDKINKDSLESLIIYKTDVYDGIGQSIQSALNAECDLNETIQNHIDNITSVIDKCDLPENLSLYRVERPRTNLRTAKQHGTDSVNLSQMVVNAAKSGDKNEIDKVKEFILDNEITVTNPRFMSTSLNDNINETFNLFGKSTVKGTRILWRLKTEPQTKGIFIEAVNITGKDANQNEILLQKNSKMTITNVDYDEENRMWIFDAKVSNRFL